MKRIKNATGILMMLCALLVSEKIYVLIVYICAATIHEFGHIVATKVLGIKIKDISFDYSGLRISIDEHLTSYDAEIWLAASGPLSNLLAACLGMIFISQSNRELLTVFEAARNFVDIGSPSLMGVCGFFIIASCVQAIINLLPVKTFDGGRIIQCMLARVFDEKVSNTVLSITSGIFLFILWTVSLYLMLRISSGFGIYIFSASIFSITLSDNKSFCDR